MKKTVCFLLVLCVCLGLFSGCGSSAIDESTITSASLVDHVEELVLEKDISIQYSIYLKSSPAWDNLSAEKRKKIAKDLIRDYEQKGWDSKYIQTYVFGYTSTGAIAFNESKTFQYGSPDEQL